jgi:hypothetical protein
VTSRGHVTAHRALPGLPVAVVTADGAVDLVTSGLADARSRRSRLLDHVWPALGDRGDAETVTGLLCRLDGLGTGADRQRALLAAAGSAPAFVEALARATLPGRERLDHSGSHLRLSAGTELSAACSTAARLPASPPPSRPAAAGSARHGPAGRRTA